MPTFLQRLQLWSAVTFIALALGASLPSLNAIQNEAFKSQHTPLKKASSFEWFWGLSVAIEPLTAVIGALLFKPIADACGRVRTLNLTTAPFAASVALQSALFFTGRIECLIVGRFLAGVFYASLSVAAQMFLAEVAPDGHKGRYLFSYSAMWNAGMLLEQLLSLIPAFKKDWYWLLLAVTILCVPATVLLPLLPEPPCFLKRRQNHEQLQSSLEFYGATQTTLDGDERVVTSKGMFYFLTSKECRNHVLLIVAFTGCLAFGGFPFVNYFSHYLLVSGLPANVSSIGSVVLMALICVTTLGGKILADRVPRRLGLKYTCVLIAVTLIGQIIARFAVSPSISVGIAIYSFLALEMSCVFGVLNSMSFLVAEILPYEYHGAGYALYSLSLNLFSALTAQTLDALEVTVPGVGLCTLLVPFLACTWVLLRLLPETKEAAPDEVFRTIRNRNLCCCHRPDYEAMD